MRKEDEEEAQASLRELSRLSQIMESEVREKGTPDLSACLRAVSIEMTTSPSKFVSKSLEWKSVMGKAKTLVGPSLPK